MSNIRLGSDNASIVVRVAPDDSLRALAREAWAIQSACNACGLAQRFAKVMSALLVHPLNKVGTDWANQNPITKAWLDKFCDLARLGQPTDAWSAVFDWRDGKTAEFRIRLDESSMAYWRKELEFD